MVQTFLDESPESRLSVLAIWLPMLPSDARSKWKNELLDDPRVEHFWDDRAKVAGSWFRDHIAELHRDKAPGNDHMQGAFGNDQAAWDVYFLYGPRAKWDEKPDQIVTWGRPVYRSIDSLRENLSTLLKSG